MEGTSGRKQEVRWVGVSCAIISGLDSEHMRNPLQTRLASPPFVKQYVEELERENLPIGHLIFGRCTYEATTKTATTDL
jgi:hypothetical protein